MARYRGSDRGVAISRTIVYGTTAVVVLLVYVAMVVGLGRMLGDDVADAPLAIAATGIVAVGFQPLRRRVQRAADRLVYGRSATPHEVLSEFSRRVAADDESLLQLAARSLVEGTGADQVEVWVRVDGHMVRMTEWPVSPAASDRAVTTVPIDHDGVELGELTLACEGGQRLSEQDQLLTERVAGGMALALGNRVRTETLESRVAQLRDSRRRLVAVHDETRRRLERDLHDGAQQQLVALKVKLGLARSISERDGAPKTAAMVGDLMDAADSTVDTMRSFARGLYPPLLESEGLGPVIATHARQAPIPVTVGVEEVGRYNREIETTVNVCVTEALENVARHAGASTAAVSIFDDDGAVTFCVRDDGVGFDVATTLPGEGITLMADRIDAIAGVLDIDSSPGEGTTISGTIPVDEGSAR